MPEKEPIEPEKRDDPTGQLSTEELAKQLGSYSQKLIEQGQKPLTPPGAQADASSSETEQH